MRLTCVGRDLRRAAATCAGAAQKGAAAAISSGVLLDVTNGNLTLSASDYEVFATVAVSSASVQDAGRVVTSARLLNQIVDRIPAEATVKITDDGTRLEICHGEKRPIRWTLPLMDADLWTPWPDVGDMIGVVDAAVLRRALAQILPAAARPGPEASSMASVRLMLGDSIVAYATDQARVARVAISWTKKGADKEVVVPIESLAHIPESGTVQIWVSPGTIAFAGDDRSVLARLIGGQYPNVTKVLQNARKHRGLTGVTVTSAALVSAVKDASAGGHSQVTIEFTDQEISVRPKGGDTDADSYAAHAGLDGPPLTVCAVAVSLIAGLTGALTELVSIMVTSKFMIVRPIRQAEVSDESSREHIIDQDYEHLIALIVNPKREA